MKNQILLEQLSEIPKECTQTRIQGVKMQIIDFAAKEQLIGKDPDDTCFHECILSNGTFIFTANNGILTSLYKVI